MLHAVHEPSHAPPTGFQRGVPINPPSHAHSSPFLVAFALQVAVCASMHDSVLVFGDA